MVRPIGAKYLLSADGPENYWFLFMDSTPRKCPSFRIVGGRIADLRAVQFIGILGTLIGR